MVHLEHERSRGRHPDSCARDKSVQDPVTGLERLGHRVDSTIVGRQVRDHLGIAEVDADDPVTIRFELSAGGGADARCRARDRNRSHQFFLPLRYTMIVPVGQTGQMQTSDRIKRLSADGTRLIEAASSDLTAGIPGCPDWTTGDLLGHVGRGWRMIAFFVSHCPPEPVDTGVGEAPKGPAVIDYAQAGLTELLEVLAVADPATPTWTFGADQTVAFFIRRAHLETLVHRVDAEAAIDDPTPVDPVEAADVVDELLSFAGRGDSRPSGSLHLHQTDGDGEWLLEVVDGEVAVRREHAKGDAALRGTGVELMMVMWGRRSVDGLELFGDGSIVDEWSNLSP